MKFEAVQSLFMKLEMIGVKQTCILNYNGIRLFQNIIFNPQVKIFKKIYSMNIP